MKEEKTALKLHYVRYPEIHDEHGHGAMKAINVKAKYHNPNEVITYSFIEGTEAQKEHVRKGIAKIIEAAPGVKIEEVESAGEVRISFNPNIGSWSYVGTDIFLIPQQNATMNIGWTESSHRVVIHEWLHTLNFSHEHIRGINFDWPKVYAHFARSGWSKSQVDQNLKMSHPEDYDFTDIDEASIMMYYIDCDLTTDGKNCGNSNNKLSQGDIKRLNEMFPEPSKPEDPKIDVFEEKKKMLSKIFESPKEIMRLGEGTIVKMALELGIEAQLSDLKRQTVKKVYNVIHS